nr:hypothetical protein [Tanacetum cinerariifolium]
MTTLAEFMIIVDADNHPLMLEKSLYDSWKSQNGTTRTKKYEELSIAEKLQAGCDLKATNIVLQGLPPDVCAIVNHHKVAKEIWDRVKLLMQGTKLSLQEKECKLYAEFDKFSSVKGETLYQCYWRFAQHINNMNVINMLMRPVQEDRKGWLNVIIVKVKDKWLGNALSRRGLGMLHGLRKRQYSDCDDVSNAKAVLMANLSNYSSDVILEVPHSDSHHNDMDN